MRILIVDDQMDMLRRLGGMLARTPHEVTLECNATRALELIRADHYDVLVTDMIMPDLDGIDLIRSIRLSKPALRIVAISGGGDVLPVNTMLRLSEAFGADRILYKPFRKAELLEAIERD